MSRVPRSKSPSRAPRRVRACWRTTSRTSTRPNFKRSDVSFQGALASALGSANGDTSVVDNTAFTTSTDSATSMRADGNNVDVDVESANLAKNQLLFDSVMAIDSKRLHTMDQAITGAH